MLDLELTLLLIPLAPGLVFMLWVIWALEKQIRWDRRHSDEIAPAKTGFNRLVLANATPKKRGTGTSTQYNSAIQR